MLRPDRHTGLYRPSTTFFTQSTPSKRSCSQCDDETLSDDRSVASRTNNMSASVEWCPTTLSRVETVVDCSESDSRHDSSSLGQSSLRARTAYADSLAQDADRVETTLVQPHSKPRRPGDVDDRPGPRQHDSRSLVCVRVPDLTCCCCWVVH